MEYKRF